MERDVEMDAKKQEDQPKPATKMDSQKEKMMSRVKIDDNDEPPKSAAASSSQTT